MVLDALVRKTEVVRRQLGSAGQVIEHRIAKKLEREGITDAAALAKEIEDEDDAERTARARAEMDDDEKARHQRLLRDQEELQRQLEDADAEGRRQIIRAQAGRRRGAAKVAATISKRRAPAPWGLSIPSASIRLPSQRIRPGPTPSMICASAAARRASASAIGAGARRCARSHSSRLACRTVARRATWSRSISSTGWSGACSSRFLSEGFRSDLSRVCAIYGPGAQPRVVLIGRLSLYGDAAARLHEEIIPVTAIWSEAGRPGKKLRALGAGRRNHHYAAGRGRP